jgi:hypothetical protein
MLFVGGGGLQVVIDAERYCPHQSCCQVRLQDAHHFGFSLFLGGGVQVDTCPANSTLQAR